MRVKRNVRSYVKPIEFDNSSSETATYIANNIKKSTINVSADGVSKTIDEYTYDLYIYSKEDYEMVEPFMGIINNLEARMNILENKLNMQGGER